MSSFHLSPHPEPHKKRTQELLKAHPEVRTLIARNPKSIFFILGIVAAQIGIAIAVSPLSWWLILLVAWFVGAFCNHALYVLIHECTHNLLFKNKSANLCASIVCDFANTIPTAISFRSYHLKHHSHQGHYDFDADLASHWEAKFIGTGWFAKAMWLLFYPLFQSVRPIRLKAINFMNKWTLVNWIVVFTFDAILVYFFGWTPICYLFASLTFSVGLHPVGARWIQEHYLFAAPQETYSYYGPLNLVALNVGYHNEHHDLPSVPWNNLPKLKKMAPEFYDNLRAHYSWTRLLLRFLFDPTLSLYSRMQR